MVQFYRIEKKDTCFCALRVAVAPCGFCKDVEINSGFVKASPRDLNTSVPLKRLDVIPEAFGD